jgi:hypothetical protein
MTRGAATLRIVGQGWMAVMGGNGTSDARTLDGCSAPFVAFPTARRLAWNQTFSMEPAPTLSPSTRREGQLESGAGDVSRRSPLHGDERLGRAPDDGLRIRVGRHVLQAKALTQVLSLTQEGFVRQYQIPIDTLSDLPSTGGC